MSAAPDLDAMLLALPIRPDNLDKLQAIRSAVRDLEKDRDEWKREWELYASSWLRNLGGAIFHKRHRIDALAMTTKHHLEGYRRARAVGLIGERYMDGLGLSPRAQLIADGWTPPVEPEVEP